MPAPNTARFFVLSLLFVVVCSQNGFSINGAAANDELGDSVGIGDVNNDGIGDILIAATYKNSIAGQCYVIFGKNSAQPFPSQFNLSSLGTNGFTVNGLAANDVLGFSVSIGGDINGDGFGDIILGATDASPGGVTYAGTAYIIFGKTTFTSSVSLNSLTGTTGFVVNGNRNNGYLARSVSIGDINGDGFGDVALGSPDTSVNGRAHIVYGKNTTFTSPLNVGSLASPNGFNINGLVTGDEFGFSVSAGGDMNGDGIKDLTISAFSADPVGSASGQVYVIFGRKSPTFGSTFNLNTLDGTNGFTINGIALNGKAGKIVSVGGDVNGDKFGDILIGSSTTNAFVIFGKNSSFTSPFALTGLNGSNGFRITGITATSAFGTQYSLGGDVNADGYDDIMIGSYTATTNRGTAYVIFGKSTFSTQFAISSLDGSNGFSIVSGTSVAGWLGYSVSLGGDVNGDGITDIALTALKANTLGRTATGQSIVIFGRNIQKTLFPAQVNLLTMNNIVSNQFQPTNYTQTNEIISFQINSADFGTSLTAPYVYSSTLSSSSPLPSWLTFNPTTLKFDGTTTQTGTFKISVFQSNFYGTVEVQFYLTLILPSTTPSRSLSPSTTSSPSRSRTSSPSFSRSLSPSTTPTHSLSPSTSLTPSKSISNAVSLSPSTTPTPTRSLSPSTTLTPSRSISNAVSLSASITPTPTRSLSPLASLTPSILSPTALSPSPSRSITSSASFTPTVSVLLPSSQLPSSSSPSGSSSPSLTRNITITSRTITVETEQQFMFQLKQEQFISQIGQPDNYSASISSDSLPSWLNFSSNDLRFEGRANQSGEFRITIVATSLNGSVICIFWLNVVPSRRDFVIYVDQTQIFEYQIPDPSGGELFFSAQQRSGAPLPAFITFNSSTLVLSSVPSIQIVPQVMFVDIIGQDENGEAHVKYDYTLVFTLSADGSSDEESVNIGAIVGGTVGGVCFLTVVVVIVVVIILIVKKKIDAQPKTREAIVF